MFLRTLLIALTLGGTALTQNSTVWNWDAGSERSNRYEGLATVKVALPQFELLSFTGQFDAFTTNARLPRPSTASS